MNAIDSLIDDFVARLRRGDEPDIEDYARQHPELADEIRDVFPALRMLEGVDIIAADAKTAEPPRQLGDYLILREVGRGGMGVVYEAAQQSLGRHVALKVLHPGLNTRPEHFERFRREARAVAALHHTNIVPVFGVGEQEGVHFYAMQFIRGQTLAAVIAELRSRRGQGTTIPATTLLHFAGNEADESPIGTTTPATTQWSTIAIEYFRGAARLAAQAADALDYAHRRGIVHRDVKPGNLLLDAAGVLWVTDFGLAKASESEALTATGDVLGTLAYMAPEQFAGSADGRTDIYGLGLVLYELATLTPAFHDSVRIRLIDKVRRGSPPSPRSIEPRMPTDLQTIVQKAIAPNPNDRYPSAAAMAEDLRRFVSGRSILARRTTWVGQAWRWSKRNRAVASLLSALVVLLLVMAIGGTMAAVINERESRRARQAEAQANDRAWRAQLAEAQAITSSGRLGQRFESLRILRASLESARSLGTLSLEDIREFRNVAVSAVTLPDAEWTAPESEEFRSLPRFYSARFDGDRSVQVYRHGDTEPLSTLPFPDQTFLYRIDPHSGRLAVRTKHGDEGISVWDTTTSPPRLLARFGGKFEGRPTLSSDGKWVACSIDRHHLGIFSIANNQKWIVPVGFASDDAFPLAFSPNGSITYPFFDKGEYQLRRWQAGHSEDLPIPTAKGRVLSLAWDGSGRFLAVADDSRFLRVWDTQTGAEVGRPREHARRSFRVYMHPRGTHVVSIDINNLLRIWEVGSGRLLVSTAVPHWNITPQWDHDQIVFDSLTALRFDRGSELVQCVHCQDGEEWGLGLEGAWFSPIDNLVATGALPPSRAANSDGIILIDPETGHSVASLVVAGQRARGFKRDGSLISSGATGVEIWPRRVVEGTIRYGPSIRTVPRHTNERDPATADGHSAVFRKEPILRFVRPGIPDRYEKTTFRDINAVAMSPDCQWTAVGSFSNAADGNVCVYKNADASVVARLATGAPTALGFSPDGSWLWAGAGSAQLWKVGSWQPGPVLGGRSVAFDPSGRIAAADDGTGCIRLIDLGTQVEIVRLQTPTREPLLPLSFSQDGRRLAAASLDSRVLFIWDLWAINQKLVSLGLNWLHPPELPAPPPRTVRIDDDYMRHANDAVRVLELRVDLPAGVKLLKKAIAENPKDLFSALRLAQIATLGPSQIRDLTLAQELCERAMREIAAMDPADREFAPRLAHFLSIRAGIEYRHGHYEQALDWLGQVDPAEIALSTSGQTLRSLTVYHLGRHDEAVRLLKVSDNRLYWSPNISKWLLKLTRDLREEPGNPPTPIPTR